MLRRFMFRRFNVSSIAAIPLHSMTAPAGSWHGQMQGDRRVICFVDSMFRRFNVSSIQCFVDSMFRRFNVSSIAAIPLHSMQGDPRPHDVGTDKGRRVICFVDSMVRRFNFIFF